MAFNRTECAADTDFERFVIGLLGEHRVQLEDASTVFDLRARTRGSPCT